MKSNNYLFNAIKRNSIIILGLFVAAYFYISNDFDIDNQINNINYKSIETIKRGSNYIILEKDESEKNLLNLPESKFSTLLISDENELIEDIISKVFIINKDENNNNIIPGNLVYVSSEAYYFKVNFGFLELPKSHFDVVSRIDQSISLYSLILISSIIFCGTFLFLFMSYNLIRITSLYTSYYYYKRLKTSSLVISYFTSLYLLIVFGILILFYYLVNQDPLRTFNYINFIAPHYTFINITFGFSCLFVFIISVLSPSNILNQIIEYLVARKGFNSNELNLELNLEAQLALKEISDLMNYNENRLDLYLIKAGFSLEHFSGISDIEKALNKNKNNQQILFNLLNLNRAGLINFNQNEISLTIFGKEKAELPSLLYVNSVPPKYDFELSRSYKSFLNNSNEEAIKICSTEVLESFTKWAIIRLEPNSEYLSEIITKHLGKNKRLEDAALGRLISIFKEITSKYKVYKPVEIFRINNIIDACINILEVVKSIRNDYSHQRDSLTFQTPRVTEDTYNLINLTRAYVSSVCRYLVV